MDTYRDEIAELLTMSLTFPAIALTFIVLVLVVAVVNALWG